MIQQENKNIQYNLNRTKGKYNITVSNNDMILSFFKEYKKFNNFNLDPKTLRKIHKKYYQKIMEAMIYKSKLYEIPYLGGYLYIQKKKIDFTYLKNKGQLKLDYKNSIKHNKKIFHLNTHTDSFRMKFKWKKDFILSRRVCNRYAFSAVRKRDRELSKAIFNKVTDYLE